MSSSVYHSNLLTCFFLFFFNDTATTEIYTLSLHDALPIFRVGLPHGVDQMAARPSGGQPAGHRVVAVAQDRKSTRLNSSHSQISYAVFCLKKKKKKHVTKNTILNINNIVNRITLNDDPYLK